MILTPIVRPLHFLIAVAETALRRLPWLLALLSTFAVMTAVAQDLPSSPHPEPISAMPYIDQHYVDLAKSLAEIEKIRVETEGLRSPWTALVSLAPFLTVIVAIIGGGLSIGKYLKEKQEANAKETHTRFMELVKMFGDKELTTRVMGAISLRIMAGEEYDEVIRMSVLYSLLWRLHFVGKGEDENKEEQEVLSHTLSSILSSYKEGDRRPRRFDRLPLSNADLSNVLFDGCHIESSTIAESTLRNTSFREATLRAVGFEAVSGESPSFEGATLDGVTFDRIEMLRSVSFEGATVGPSGVRFSRCMLDGCRFSDMTLKGTIEFADCDLIDPWFGGIDRARVMFSGKSYIDGKAYQGALGGAGQG